MIKLSRLTDYAVALLAQMVSDEKRVWAASELAETTGLPQPTVSKVLKGMTKSGIITAQRGAAGGYRLGRPARDITVGAIIEAMDGPIAITSCADGGDHSCHVESICPMQGHWNLVNRAIRQALESVSLADVTQVPAEALAKIAAPARAMKIS